MTTYGPNEIDRRAMERMAPLIVAALEAQEPNVRDQLEAAMAARKIRFTAEPDALVGAAVVLAVDGYPLCSFALADLVDDESPLDRPELARDELVEEVERWLAGGDAR